MCFVGYSIAYNVQTSLPFVAAAIVILALPGDKS
jgi:hypothetical protein